MEDRKYTYSLLVHRQTRLVRVYRDGSGRLCCQLRIICLDQPDVRYVAISYAWGDPALVSKIWCEDNGYLNLTASVNDILTNSAVSENDDRYWFIDLLCINQQDLEEKGHQVRLMGDVFASATQVLVWLGQKSEDSDLAIAFVSVLGHTMQKVLLKDAANRHVEQENGIIGQYKLCAEPGCEHPSPSWNALSRLLERPWFRRMWVLQEIFLAPQDIKVLCGHLALPWTILAGVLFRIQSYGLSRLIEQENRRWNAGLHATSDARSSLECVTHMFSQTVVRTQSLVFLLIRMGNFKASDPRDKIYANFGMATDVDEYKLDPDYHATTEEVYTSWARALLTKSDHPLISLSRAGIGWPRNFEHLPSWVTDWTAEHMGATCLGTLAENAGYHASGSSPSCIRAKKLKKLSNSIGISAVVVDTVDRCIPRPIFDPPGEIEDVRSLLQWIEDLECMVRSSYQYQSNPDDVLWRTLIGDMIYT